MKSMGAVPHLQCQQGRGRLGRILPVERSPAALSPKEHVLRQTWRCPIMKNREGGRYAIPSALHPVPFILPTHIPFFIHQSSMCHVLFCPPHSQHHPKQKRKVGAPTRLKYIHILTMCYLLLLTHITISISISISCDQPNSRECQLVRLS